MALRFARQAATFLVGALSGVASVAAIIAYKSPQSLSVITGIPITLCSLDRPVDSRAQLDFFKTLFRDVGRVVYVNHLEITYGCLDGIVGQHPTAAQKRELLNDTMIYDPSLFPYKDGAIADSTVTIPFPKIQSNNPPLEDLVMLSVTAPNKETPFSKGDCDEHCFGANGVYRVSLTSGEGMMEFSLSPFAHTDSIFDSYQCTLDRLNAVTFWQRLFACRF